MFFSLLGEPSIDTTPPTISNCPTGVNVQVPAGSSGGTAAWDIPTAVDDSGATPVRSSNFQPGDFFTLGTTLVVYTFSDASGNIATCSFEVTIRTSGVVVDVTPPTISNCPSDVSVQVAAGATSGIAFWTEPTATDDSGEVPSVTSTHISGQSSFPVGTTLVRYTFRDQSGNSAICSFNVIVTASGGGGGEDTSSPVISGCPEDIVVTSSSTFTQVTWTAPTATDDSGEVTVETNYPNPSIFVSSNMPTITVTYTFSDPSGNTAVCEFTISVSSGSGKFV